VRVPVMNVRRMRMRMRERFMPVNMRVRLTGRIGGTVRMAMMLVMHMGMLMLQGLVHMEMLMLFGKV
jgi:hypothetical protein